MRLFRGRRIRLFGGDASGPAAASPTVAALCSEGQARLE